MGQDTAFLDGFQSISDSSVDLIIADPPYNLRKDYGNKELNLNELLINPIDQFKKWLQNGPVNGPGAQSSAPSPAPRGFLAGPAQNTR